MATTNAGVAQFKGEFKVLDSTGKKTLLTLPFDEKVSLEQLTHIIRTIPVSTSDQLLDFGGVARAKAIYIDSNVEIEVKFESNANTGHKLNGPTVLLGEITAVYVTTTTEVACVEMIVGGPSV
jgi:hypothetical protein